MSGGFTTGVKTSWTGGGPGTKTFISDISSQMNDGRLSKRNLGSAPLGRGVSLCSLPFTWSPCSPAEPFLEDPAATGPLPSVSALSLPPPL